MCVRFSSCSGAAGSGRAAVGGGAAGAAEKGNPRLRVGGSLRLKRPPLGAVDSPAGATVPPLRVGLAGPVKWTILGMTPFSEFFNNPGVQFPCDFKHFPFSFCFLTDTGTTI